MATVDKNFRIKNGLVIEGSTATLNGNNILSENTQAGDSYILNLVGGATLVKSVGSNLSVDGAGELSLDLVGIVEDIAGTRLTTDGSTLNVDVDGIADDLTGSYDFATNFDVSMAISSEATFRDAAIAIAKGEAQDYADGLASNYDAAGSAAAAQTAAEGYADGLVDNLVDGTTPFTEINVNDEAKHVAATSSSLESVPVTAYQWAKADYRSGKFLVKIDNGTHNEISEILVTLDSSDNVAITEYAIVGTNGSRGTITASVSGANVQLRVDPVNDSTIKVSGTLLK